jgi:MbtH protein
MEDAMREDDSDDKTIYKVVVNLEEQYSVWPAHKTLPPGWREEGLSGLKQDCLAHIGQIWTDMRPLSLRRHMEKLQASQVDSD